MYLFLIYSSCWGVTYSHWYRGVALQDVTPGNRDSNATLRLLILLVVTVGYCTGLVPWLLTLLHITLTLLDVTSEYWQYWMWPPPRFSNNWTWPEATDKTGYTSQSTGCHPQWLALTRVTPGYWHWLIWFPVHYWMWLLATVLDVILGHWTWPTDIDNTRYDLRVSPRFWNNWMWPSATDCIWSLATYVTARDC